MEPPPVALVHSSALQQVIWAALFALAVLVREGSTPHSPALRAIAAAGVLPILQTVLGGYKVGARPTASFSGLMHATCPASCDLGNPGPPILLMSKPERGHMLFEIHRVVDTPAEGMCHAGDPARQSLGTWQHG